MISLAYRTPQPPGLRAPLSAAMRYFIVTEPMGSALVAARDVAEARATYFETVKDDLWGEPEIPESARPYIMGSIVARLADAEDLANLRSIVPQRPPIRAIVLSPEVKACLDAQARSTVRVRPVIRCAFLCS